VTDTPRFWEVWDTFDRGEVIATCAWCDRIRLDDGWQHAPTGVLDAIDRRQSLSHSICPECLAAQSATGVAS
jgi:hypothetical protein